MATIRRTRRILEHIKNLGSDNKKVSEMAEQYLIRHYGSEPLPYAIQACKSENPVVRFRAVWILGKTKDPLAYETILGLCDDPDEGVRYDATLALGHLGDRRAIEPLVELCIRGDETGSAITALSILMESDRSEIEKLRDHPNEQVRGMAVELLEPDLDDCCPI